jgi:hypothetical protein
MKPRSKAVESSAASKRSSSVFDEEAKARPAKRKTQESIRDAADTGLASVRREIETEHSASPSNEQIAERARSIWEREGRPEGRDEEFWFRAESEVKAERS